MPIITGNAFFASVDELAGPRRGTPYALGEDRDYIRQWLVKVKDKNMGPAAVCRAPGLPLPGSFYVTPSDYDLLARAIRFEANPRDTDESTWEYWVVTVTYSTRLPAGGFPDAPGWPSDGSGGASNNPELEPAEVEWDFEVVQAAYFEDLNDKPFLNSAGQKFQPHPTFEVGYPVLVVSRNELYYDVDKAIEYAYAVNDDVFLGAPPGTVQCYPIKAKQLYKGALRYWRMQYRFRFAVFRPDGILLPWSPVKVMDMGTQEVVVQNVEGIDTFVERPILRFGHKITAPVPLQRIYVNVDGVPTWTGRVIAKPKNANGSITPEYIHFVVYRSANFTKLLMGGLIRGRSASGTTTTTTS